MPTLFLAINMWLKIEQVPLITFHLKNLKIQLYRYQSGVKIGSGVNFYEEDGFGLRPNISLRGTSPERSAKISIMEDGVLIAPAPYSAPAAYYFPSVARMQAVEILKGSSQIQYGPFTTGGAINFVSAQIPNTFQGQVRASYGSFETSQLHARVGDQKETVGYMVEFLNHASNGFKNLPSGANTGFDINDVVAKFRVNSRKEASLQQSLEAKFQYSDQDSNETYLGLTDEDFANAPFDRYAASQVDNITTEHVQLMLTHTLDFTKDLRLTTQAYHNKFSRNWYKLNDVSANGEKVGITDILSNPEQFSSHMAIIRGDEDASNDAFLCVPITERIILKVFNQSLISIFMAMKPFMI